jgi:Fic family protein
MLLNNRKPHTSSEKMIFNNYKAMQFIQENKEKELTPKFVLDIHRIVTNDMLEDAGQLRAHDDIQVVDNRDQRTVHVPPKAVELENRLKLLCEFANTDENDERYYIHPVIKAISLHFMLAYDHPFNDGNGRTARALFYWFMLSRGYWLIEYISISHVIKKSPIKYAKAFVYTESDDNDVNYFIFHQIDVIMKAINALYHYVDEQKKLMKEMDALLHHNAVLNHRQISLVQHALKNPDTPYVIEYYKHSHNVTYQTARSDLLKLVELGLFEKNIKGRAFVFFAVTDLKKRIAMMR